MLSRAFLRFWSDTRGATAIEYGLIAALISVMLIAGAMVVGNTVGNLFGFGGAANIIGEKSATIR